MDRLRETSVGKRRSNNWKYSEKRPLLVGKRRSNNWKYNLLYIHFGGFYIIFPAKIFLAFFFPSRSSSSIASVWAREVHPCGDLFANFCTLVRTISGVVGAFACPGFLKNIFFARYVLIIWHFSPISISFFRHHLHGFFLSFRSLRNVFRLKEAANAELFFSSWKSFAEFIRAVHLYEKKRREKEKRRTGRKEIIPLNASTSEQRIYRYESGRNEV